LADIDVLALIEVEKQKHPGTDFILCAELSDIRGAVEAVRRGASNFLPKPIDPELLRDVVAELLERRELEDEVRYLKGRLNERYGIDSIITRSGAMEVILRQIRAVAKTDSTVLLCGETGVGKELVANVIHQLGDRQNAKFLAINCGALPDSLIESELFGYEKGAFTGADRARAGKFEAAAGGTLFLDEIATISPAMQVRLLRVLQERSFSRLGGNAVLPADVRVICATNRALKEMVREGGFREDLYYRVNVFPITIPPLRERKEDIPLLAARFLRQFRTAMKKPITDIADEVMNALKNYSWPGNVRELENLIERAVIMEDSHTLSPSSFPPEVMELEPMVVEYDESLPLKEARKQVMNRFEKEYLSLLLEKYRGRINACARHAGVTARSINEMMRRHNLFKEDFKQRI
jgi:DNA-binding NtrC family response regulator